MNFPITKGWFVGYFLTTAAISLFSPKPFYSFLLSGISGLIVGILLAIAEKGDK